MTGIRPSWLLILVWLASCMLVAALPTRAHASDTLVLAPLFDQGVAGRPLQALTVKAPAEARSVAFGESFEATRQMPTAPTVMEGCAAKSLREGTTLFAGGWSHCMGGRLSLAERQILAIDYEYAQMDSSAYAMQADPRRMMQAPLSATAGIAVPVAKATHIGIEYSYTQRLSASPFHFSDVGGPADEMIGHSATVRLGLEL
ncbi:MAG: hypothetical protein AAF337_09580 [Pseudomonadota bacterium]